jgi:hypothetical protein
MLKIQLNTLTFSESQSSTLLRILDENDPFDFSYFKNFLGLFGNILALIFIVSPISIMVKLHKKQLNPKDTPFFLFISFGLNCIFWVSYGILKTQDKFFIIFCNGVGIPFNIGFFWLYLFYSFDRKFLKTILYSLLVLLIAGGIFSIFTFAIGKDYVSQYSALVFNVCLFMAPGQKIVKNNTKLYNMIIYLLILYNIYFFFYFFLFNFKFNFRFKYLKEKMVP